MASTDFGVRYAGHGESVSAPKQSGTTVGAKRESTIRAEITIQQAQRQRFIT